ncbi:MAG TPA: hypothetical protein VNP04_21905 [Alphaproteobacteria bacterium]|nr:hypothetical protein [Alphaproteobacteria bacterium]
MTPFSDPWTLLFAIVAAAAFFVVIPVMSHVFRRYKEPQVLTCPETGRRAMVIVDAKKAAYSAAIGEPHLRATDCSLWPERKNCEQTCLKHP